MGEAEDLEEFERACALASRAFEEACQAALQESTLDGVYLSPLWDTETSDPSISRAWKRSVLRRVPGAGAEPWGHVFLLVLRGEGREGRVGDDPERSHPFPPTASARSTPPTEPVVLSAGPPRVLLLLRPRDPVTEERLRAFAQAVSSAFARSGALRPKKDEEPELRGEGSAG